MRKDMDITGIEKSNIYTIKILYNKTRNSFHIFSRQLETYFFCLVLLHYTNGAGEAKLNSGLNSSARRFNKLKT